MTFPRDCSHGTQANIRRSIQRRAVILAALQCGEDKDAAAQRVGITRNHLNRLVRADWRPGC